MTGTGGLNRSYTATQLTGAAIQATLFVLPVAKGVLYLAKLMGFEALGASRTSVLLVVGICWLVLFFPNRAARRPKLFRTLNDPAVPAGAKIKATFTDWFGLLMIVSTLIWIAAAIVSGTAILP